MFARGKSKHSVAGVSDPGCRAGRPASLRPATGRRRANANRRGVLLLVVLSMLVLFVLLGLTFVLVAARYRSNTNNALKGTIGAVDPREQLSDAALIFLRGSTNRMCAIGPYSLLEDLLGSDGFRSTLNANPVSRATGQLFDLTFQGSGQPPDGYFNGLLLTMVDGPAANQSTRVVGSSINAASVVTLRVVAFENGTLPQSGNTFVINGRPFNGTGLGYDAASAKNFATFSPPVTLPPPMSTNVTLYAGLLPNARVAQLWQHLNGPDGIPGTADDVGLDEEYDAADPQNPHLAFIPVLATLTPQNVIPSFHRPKVVSDWLSQIATASPDDQRRVLRSAMFRPLGPMAGVTSYDHPNFTGSTPNFDPINGPWDVDNDANGVSDSVWVDLGFPAQAGPDGKMYKPLFAILCLDLDGRLNVNVHGAPGQVTPPMYSNLPVADRTGVPPTARGLGFGVADIDLSKSGLINATQYQNILNARYASASETVPGNNGQEPLSVAQHFELPDLGVTGLDGSGYPWPADFHARGALGLDFTGQPLIPGAFTPGDAQDYPYELDVSRKAVRAAGGIDSPFTAAELEPVLRPWDIDTSSLPSRLRNILGSSSPQVFQRILTTDSVDLPTPGIVVPREMFFQSTGLPRTPNFTQRTGVTPGHAGMIDLYRYKIMEALDPGGTTPPSKGQVDTVLAQIFPYELSMGLRFDINRPFGNGRNETPSGQPGDDAVDEPEEAIAAAGEQFWNGIFPPSRTPIPFDHDNDGVTSGDPDANLARQAFARHLYCLVMLLKGEQEIDFDGNPGNNTPAETAQGLAQWAVNVVDFRDADSTMTFFEYDDNPWDGWTATGNLAVSNSKVVVGCERPPLLLTESLAYHDRRTADLDLGSDNGEKGDPNAMPPKDDDYDQEKVPIGRLFVEIFNPGAAGNYSATSEQRVNLGAYTSGGHPVWRIAVSNRWSDVVAADPDALDKVTLPATSIDRKIYFTDPNAYPDPESPATSNSFYPASSAGVLGPQSYALLGPAASTTIKGLYGSGTKDVKVQSGVAAIDSPTDLQPTHTPVVIDRIVSSSSVKWRPLNASEPLPGTNANYDGFWATNPDQTAVDAQLPGGAKDQPWDTGASNTDPALNLDQTTASYKMLFLQRLANPNQNWDAERNPYITVDTLPIDLTAYTSGTPVTEGEFANATTPPGNFNFRTRERGPDPAGAAPNGPSVNLWARVSNNANVGSAPPTIGYNVAGKQNETLGFLNYTFERAAQAASGAATGRYGSSTLSASYSQYYGAPTYPFPWITWNNRPFANVGELLLVPHSSPARLYADTERAASSATPFSDAAGPFGHLMNMLYAVAPAQPGQHLYRLFDYVRVPSRFAGTELFLSPPNFASASPDAANLHPPFNRVSNYRDPGRVNISTIADSRVWDALLAGAPTSSSPTWADVQSSMGYVLGATPAYFATPFRSPAGALLNLPNISEPAESDVSLYRKHPTATTQPLLSFTSTNPNDRSDRNAGFQYQNLQRLADKLTTRSNVYAVWITVGYFEVTPVTTTSTTVPQPQWAQVYPDGYQLGAELGSDTGDIKRHRAFYIMDRSIPVGYERGQDHNVEDAILVNRFIE